MNGGRMKKQNDYQYCVTECFIDGKKKGKNVNVPNFMKQGEDKETFGCI